MPTSLVLESSHTPIFSLVPFCLEIAVQCGIRLCVELSTIPDCKVPDYGWECSTILVPKYIYMKSLNIYERLVYSWVKYEVTRSCSYPCMCNVMGLVPSIHVWCPEIRDVIIDRTSSIFYFASEFDTTSFLLAHTVWYWNRTLPSTVCYCTVCNNTLVSSQSRILHQALVLH